MKKVIKHNQCTGKRSARISQGNRGKWNGIASGQIPVNPATGEIPEGIEAQAEQVLNNVKNLLAAAGASMEQVVKTTVFIQNMDDFGKVNEIYAKYFEGACPARSCVEVSKLPKGVLMEMEAIAAK